MILLRGTLSKLVKFSVLEANFTIVILDKIALASVYLPNSSYADDVYAAHVHDFQEKIVRCFAKGAKSVIGGGDLNFKDDENIRHYTGECCFVQETNSTANLARDVAIRALMARIGCHLTSTFNNSSSSYATHQSWGPHGRKAQLDYVFASRKLNGRSECLNSSKFMNSDHYPSKSILQLYERSLSFEQKPKSV